ncbi:2-aminoethylphosphonate--pyruvate transaminase [Vreelandella rituensis]|uniref:2-aminoethylphosphonate--pyruvate transaminase n=1 Tax=Vreelandella rituensis TaxID=2282306 RepID=A0A368TN09_9GAMM|nr:2-aminoethylphosphonate--pyruvate transaminase [Halomonas rituensis]RCV85981.1 2-aminoethylphosphonate--pyruvate transaminase [Halomonas rituensis]
MTFTHDQALFEKTPYLLTPGPLSTSVATKNAMQQDWGSWDSDFNTITADIRRQLLSMAGDDDDAFVCVPMQGSGTFAVEATLASITDSTKPTLVLSNGAYGKRAAQILSYLGRPVQVLDKGDYLPPLPEEVDAWLTAHPEIATVVLIHCETSSGILNPLEAIADVVALHGKRFIVDAMSSFGAVPINVQRIQLDALVSSANKCIEGVPGFGFVIIHREVLKTSENRSHSLSLDLHAQWSYMERTGQWRFTPPTHTVMAFHQALAQHQAEGGVAGRLARYTQNRDVLVEGMRQRGFQTLLDDAWLSPIITTFFSPRDPNFAFARFYAALKARGFIIYPGKLTEVESFRIGHIGQVDSNVMNALLVAIDESLNEMDVTDTRPPQAAYSMGELA